MFKRACEVTFMSVVALGAIAACSSQEAGVPSRGATSDASVPTVCLDALDYADAMGRLAGEAMEIAGDGMSAMVELTEAVARDDLEAATAAVGTLNERTTDLYEKAPQIKEAVDSYMLASQQCRELNAQGAS